MFELDPSQFDPPVRTLLESEPLNVLAPGSPNEALRGTLASLHADTVLAPAAAVDNDMAQCCVSGLWLLYDFLDESHVISQDINTTTGSYWHGIMHRRKRIIRMRSIGFGELGITNYLIHYAAGLAN